VAIVLEFEKPRQNVSTAEAASQYFTSLAGMMSLIPAINATVPCATPRNFVPLADKNVQTFDTNCQNVIEDPSFI
jgi:hypothetical protein